MSTDDLKRLAEQDRMRDERGAIVDGVRMSFDSASPEELKREAERELTAVRKDMRAE